MVAWDAWADHDAVETPAERCEQEVVVAGVADLEIDFDPPNRVLRMREGRQTEKRERANEHSGSS